MIRSPKSRARCRVAGPSISVPSEAPSLHYKRNFIFAVKCDLIAEADMRSREVRVRECRWYLCVSNVFTAAQVGAGGTGSHEMLPLINDCGDNNAGSIRNRKVC